VVDVVNSLSLIGGRGTDAVQPGPRKSIRRLTGDWSSRGGGGGGGGRSPLSARTQGDETTRPGPAAGPVEVSTGRNCSSPGKPAPLSSAMKAS